MKPRVTPTTPIATRGTSASRSFVAKIHYEEWWERRWRFWWQIKKSWWSVVEIQAGGSSFCIADTLTELQGEIIPAIRFMLEDDTSTIWVRYRYLGPSTLPKLPENPRPRRDRASGPLASTQGPSEGE